jgi:phosphate transport system substrate-binding protein
MNRTIVVLSALALAACGKSEGDATSSLPGSKAAPTATATGPLTLTGAGATFPNPLYQKWASTYEGVKPEVKVNYQSIGSGGGIRQITEKTVDFGASDAPMNEEQLGKAPGILHIPTCLGAVVLTYNVDGVPSGLKLTPEAVTGIFSGSIKDWDDAAISKENPELKLPHKPIASVHRSDGSGTTKVFTDYLSAVSSTWKASPGTGTSVNWPGGLGAKGNEGVAGLVKTTPGAIGYMELAYAAQNKLTFATLKNKAGKYVVPSTDSISAAAAGAVANIPADFRTSLIDAEGEGSYPISAFTYILVHETQADEAKGKALVGFLHWALHEGQALTKPLDYAPLPEALVAKIDAKLAGVKGPGGAALLSPAPKP